MTIPKLPQVEHDEATGELREAYDDIQATLRVGWVAFAIRALAVFPGYVPRAWRAARPNYRVLANWPEYLELELDEVLAPTVRSEPYDAKARELVIEARRLVQAFPSPAAIAPDAIADVATPAEISAITGLLALYQRFIADVTIDVLMLKRALDGREAAAASPFPLD